MVCWIFDSPPKSGALRGGLASAEVLPTTVDTFVREVLQNCRDQRATEEPVRVRVALHELSAQSLEGFLECIGWDELRPHIDGAADPANVTIAARLREGLGLAESGPFRVLVIEDAFTHGLSGEEQGKEGNYAHLVRNELTTPPDRRGAGGSFGIGKSVLWSFSALSTVLFYSRIPSASATGETTRFIARTLLPSHEAGGLPWEGQGWFGMPEPPDGDRAVSAWGDDADELAGETFLARSDDAAGTSIAVLAFDDPTRDVEPTVVELCAEIAASAKRWFWPALLRDDMSVEVVGFVDGQEVYSEEAGVNDPDLEPLVELMSAVASGTTDSGVELRDIPLEVPARLSAEPGAPSVGFVGYATLAVLSGDAIDTSAAGAARVATQRGAGMVVQYWEPAVARQGITNFVAVLLAGTARSDSPEDRAVEEFLRAAEPPAHDRWIGTTGRLRQEYERGGGARLDRFFAALDSELRSLLDQRTFDSDDGPDALKKLFPMPAGGGDEHVEIFRLSRVSQSYKDGRWGFSGTFSRKSSKEKGPWAFTAEVSVGREGGGARARLLPIALQVTGGAGAELDPDGSTPERSRVTVPADVEAVQFRVESSDPDHSTRGTAEQVSVKLKLRGTKGSV